MEISIAISAVEGLRTGTSSLDPDVTAQPLLSGSAALNNYGNYYTGSLQAGGNLWINSPAGIGDQISLQGVGSAIHGDLGYGAPTRGASPGESRRR